VHFVGEYILENLDERNLRRAHFVVDEHSLVQCAGKHSLAHFDAENTLEHFGDAGIR
jgi:hypothetical protein